MGGLILCLIGSVIITIAYIMTSAILVGKMRDLEAERDRLEGMLRSVNDVLVQSLATVKSSGIVSDPVSVNKPF